MKDVIFTGLLFAAAAVACPALAASIDRPMVIADLELDEAQKAELQQEKMRDALLQDAIRRQNESLLKRQMHQLELFREQAKRDAARAKKQEQP